MPVERFTDEQPKLPNEIRRVHWVAVFLAIVVFSILVWPVWWLFVFVVLVVAEQFGVSNRRIDLQIQIALFLAVVATALFARLAYRFFKWQRNQRPECLECGYNLTGNVSGVCPECGTPVHRLFLPPEEGDGRGGGVS